LFEKLENIERENLLLRHFIDSLEEMIQLNEADKSSYRNRSVELQNYLNLFLSHPVYKVFKFFKQLFHNPTNGVNNADRIESIYESFVRINEPSPEILHLQKQGAKLWSSVVQIDIVTAVYNPGLSEFQQTAQSLLNQTYANWIWYPVDASEQE